MNRRFITWANTNKLIFLGLSLSSTSWSQFRDDMDRRIAAEVVSEFRRDCGQRVSIESETFNKVLAASRAASESGNKTANECFRESVSLMSGVYYIYEKLCGAIAVTGPSKEPHLLARQLLNATKYQNGIRPYHGQLTNCLSAIPKNAGKPFITSANDPNLAPEVMSEAIQSIRVNDPFPATKVPFR